MTTDSPVGYTKRYVSPTDRTFAENVHTARRAQRLTLQAICDEMHARGFRSFYRQTILEIVHGRRTTSIGEAVALCDIFGVSLDTMTSGPVSISLAVTGSVAAVYCPPTPDAAVRPYIGRWVAMGGGKVIAAAADVVGLAGYLRDHGLTATTMFRVPTDIGESR